MHVWYLFYKVVKIIDFTSPALYLNTIKENTARMHEYI